MFSLSVHTFYSFAETHYILSLAICQEFRGSGECSEIVPPQSVITNVLCWIVSLLYQFSLMPIEDFIDNQHQLFLKKQNVCFVNIWPQINYIETQNNWDLVTCKTILSYRYQHFWFPISILRISRIKIDNQLISDFNPFFWYKKWTSNVICKLRSINIILLHSLY